MLLALVMSRGGTMRSIRTVLVSVVMVVAVALPTNARAFCGFYVTGADAPLVNNATLVVMMRQGTRTVLSMQNNYQGPPSDFAMVVPVPVVLSEDNVKTLPKEVFTQVDRLAAPRLVEYWEQDPCFQPEYDMEENMPMPAPTASAEVAREAVADDLGVTIEAEFTVGEYEIVILSARDSTGLDTWLRRNEYNIPEGAEEVLRPYVESGMKFFVAKVDIEKVTFQGDQLMLSPLRFHYDTPEFSLPVRLGLLNSSGTQDLIVHILGENQRYEVANYENVTVPTNIDVSNDVRERFGEFYAAMFDATLERNPRSIVTEYAWQASNCDPCPGPVLDASVLMTLGGDVLPGLSGSRRADARFDTPTAAGDVDASVAGAVVGTRKTGFVACYQAALDRSSTIQGSASIRLTIGTDGTISGEPRLTVQGGRDAELETCIQSQLAGLRFPPPQNGASATLTVPFNLMSEAVNEWEVQSRLMSFVLTRLHARYSKEALNEDLVFRPAGPIVGGREFLQSNGKLEEGSQPVTDVNGVNNFQARYAIRHPWEGPITCDNPRRGVWGGPPAGVGASQEVRPAMDLAFAPRGAMPLREMLRQNVPELALEPTTTTSALLSGATGVAAGAAAAAAGAAAATEDSSGCGCSTSTDGSEGVGLLFALLGLAGLWATRRRS
jgi:MYXO-CTERM domain-containing protein